MARWVAHDGRVLTFAARARRVGSARVRGSLWRAAIIASGGGCGPGLEVDRGATLRYGPHSGLRFGSGVRLGRGVILDVLPSGVLELGDHVKVQHYSLVSALERVTIGPRTQVAEHTSIRDSDHGAGGEHDNIATPVTIGADVWIACGVAVLRGATIGDRAVVGANSVVTRSRPVAADTRVAGSPAQPLHGEA